MFLPSFSFIWLLAVLLKQSQWRDFALQIIPGGTFGSQLQRVGKWHLVRRGQWRCSTSHNSHHSPPTVRCIWPNMSIMPRLRNPVITVVSAPPNYFCGFKTLETKEQKNSLWLQLSFSVYLIKFFGFSTLTSLVWKTTQRSIIIKMAQPQQSVVWQ